MLGVVEQIVGTSWDPESGLSDSSHMLASGRTRGKDGGAGTPEGCIQDPQLERRLVAAYVAPFEHDKRRAMRPFEPRATPHGEAEVGRSATGYGQRCEEKPWHEHAKDQEACYRCSRRVFRKQHMGVEVVTQEGHHPENW